MNAADTHGVEQAFMPAVKARLTFGFSR